MDVVHTIRTRTATGDGQLADVTILADVGNAATGTRGSVTARSEQETAPIRRSDWPDSARS